MNSNTQSTEVYLSSKEAGEILGYTHDYISRLCRQGHMVGKRVGREWFVKPSDLETFKKKHEVVLQEKKKQLSQKLSQIRKEHEAQKRAQKQVVQNVSSSLAQPVTYSIPVSAPLQEDSFKPTPRLIIPKQLIAVCVLALVLLIPTVVDVISSTPIAPVRSQDKVATISQSTPVFSMFGESVATLPSVTIERISNIGDTYLFLYQTQGHLILDSKDQIHQIGSGIISGYELLGESFIEGSQNVIDSYSDVFSYIFPNISHQFYTYAQNVVGGYQYVVDTSSYALNSFTYSLMQTNDFVVDNISQNIFEMNKTVALLSSQLSASIGNLIQTKNTKDSSSEVIFVK